MSEAKMKEYKARLPLRVQISIKNTDEGLWAKISTTDGKIDNCYTQASSATELLLMVNDAILTYFEIPEDSRKDVGFYVPLSKQHVRIEDMFNQFVSMEKEIDQRGRSEKTLTLQNSVC
ncbi:MAG TPA: hypothetical protein VI981_05085 [Candidatus Paceibacterota bacterium]